MVCVKLFMFFLIQIWLLTLHFTQGIIGLQRLSPEVDKGPLREPRISFSIWKSLGPLVILAAGALPGHQFADGGTAGA
jgi:hypothetical protein